MYVILKCIIITRDVFNNFQKFAIKYAVVIMIQYNNAEV